MLESLFCTRTLLFARVLGTHAYNFAGGHVTTMSYSGLTLSVSIACAHLHVVTAAVRCTYTDTLHSEDYYVYGLYA